MAVLRSGGGLVRAGGDNQPFPRSSVPLSQFADGITLLGNGRTVSYGELYRTQLWVAIAVNKLTRQIARLPLKVYKRTSNGRERVKRSQLVQVLNRPFPQAGSTHLKQAIALPLLVNGNSALRKYRATAGGSPTELQPLSWGAIQVHGPRTSPVELWETFQQGMPRFIDPDEVVHTAWRGLDGPIGISPLQQLEVTVAIEDAAQRWQTSMLKNSARPPSAVSASPEFLNLDREDRQVLLNQLRADLDDVYTGPENAGKPALLPPGLTWSQIGHTAVEASLIDQRKLSREEVAACYDVPGPLIGQLERSTFNNITEMHRMLYVTVLGPWLSLIEETLQAQLIDPEPVFRGDLYVEFDLSEVLKGDILQRSQALALQIGYGVLTIDEARAIENRETFGLPETSLPLYPANNLVPVGRAPQKPEAPAAGDEQPPSDADAQEAARAIAIMEPAQVAKLLSLSGGSMVEAIFALARDDRDPEAPALNGHGPQ